MKHLLCKLANDYLLLVICNLQFQIGGSFPLHGNDCVTLRPETVQEIVAIQWALTHWNQNSLNTNSKIGKYSFDLL